MKNNLGKYFNEHKYPEIFYRFPFLLRIHQLATSLIVLRVWYIRKVLQKLFESKKEFSYLDAGCGPGDHIIPYLKKYKSASFIGVDKSFNNVEICSVFAGKYNYKNAGFFCSRIEEFKLKRRFDIVSCITVLPWIENDELALKKIYSHLENKGKLVLYVPVNFERVLPFFEKVKKKFFKDVTYETIQSVQREYSYEEIESKLLKTGFTIEEVTHTYGKFAQVAYEIQSLLLYLLQKFHPVFVVFPVILIVLFYPVLLMMMVIDFNIEKDRGNGVLIVARKN